MREQVILQILIIVLLIFIPDALEELKAAKESADKAAALEEMVTSLSEQKVQSITELENLQRKLKQSEPTCKETQIQLNDLTQNFEDVQKKCDDFETENAAKERYIIQNKGFKLFHNIIHKQKIVFLQIIIQSRHI